MKEKNESRIGELAGIPATRSGAWLSIRRQREHLLFSLLPGAQALLAVCHGLLPLPIY